MSQGIAWAAPSAIVVQRQARVCARRRRPFLDLSQNPTGQALDSPFAERGMELVLQPALPDRIRDTALSISADADGAMSPAKRCTSLAWRNFFDRVAVAA
jgi:hypothetical protein